MVDFESETLAHFFDVYVVGDLRGLEFVVCLYMG